jgi:hypothetical protein
MEALGAAFGGSDIEVENVLSDSQLRVKSDCRLVTRIGLNIDDIDTPSVGKPLKFFDHRSGDAHAAMDFIDCQVVNVDLGSSLLEFRKHICGEAAHHFGPGQRRYGNECSIGEHLPEIEVIRLSPRIGFPFAERLAKHGKHCSHDPDVLASENLKAKSGRGLHEDRGLAAPNVRHERRRKEARSGLWNVRSMEGQAAVRWCRSVDEFPSVRSIEPAYLNRLLKARIKIVQIDAVLAAWLGDNRFPMRGAPAGLAAYIAQRLVAPDVLGRILRMSFYPNCSELVIRPESANAPAERTVALGRPLRH